MWQDELTSVNGTSLTYDANGNVLTYGNMEFEWTNGRTLSQITVNPEDENGTADVYSYTYDESGIRSSKTVNGVTTYFTTKDGVILSQTDGTNTMYFQYDNSGNPTGFIYNGTQYFYLTNQMGDVIGITDNAGSLIATYTYGAWGEVLATTPATAGNTAQLAIANANPLRYRGYYLDQETGYYYLQSRYYNPMVSRFINSDDLSIPELTKSIDANLVLFQYCGNNPVNDKDSKGMRSKAEWIRLANKNLLFRNKKGFQKYERISLLSKAFCLYLGVVAVNAFGSNGRNYKGMSALRIAVELWAHAIVHYAFSLVKATRITAMVRLANTLHGHTNPIDVNYDEWRYPLMWWMWAHFGNYQQLKKAAFQTGKNYYYHKKGAK